MALDNTFARCVDRTTLASKKGKMQGLKDAEVHSYICCAQISKLLYNQLQLEFIGEFCCDLAAINDAHKKARLDKQREEVSECCPPCAVYNCVPQKKKEEHDGVMNADRQQQAALTSLSCFVTAFMILIRNVKSALEGSTAADWLPGISHEGWRARCYLIGYGPVFHNQQDHYLDLLDT